MDALELIKTRRSIRRYTAEQVPHEDVERVVEAGLYAPSAGGGQRSMIVAVNNCELTTRIGRMNMAGFSRASLAGSYVSRDQPSVIDDPTIRNGFYGAPAVLCVFCQERSLSDECLEHDVTFAFIETGSNFIVDGRAYRIPKRLQGEQAFKSGAGYEGRPIEWRLADPLGLPLSADEFYVPRYREKCRQCGGRLICNGCANCGCGEPAEHLRTWEELVNA